MCCCCVPDCFLVILALIFPPLPVIIKRGLCSCDFLINVCLCILGWIPGTIHAWYIILSSPDIILDDEERQIFIVTPPDATNVIVHRQPNQTRVKFNHPEPFLESNNKHNSNHSFNDNNALNPTLSPLTHIQGDHKCQLSPSSNNNNSYGSADDDTVNDSAQPPSYENVMNETSKQFK